MGRLQLCALNFVIHRNIHKWWKRNLQRDFLRSIHCKMSGKEGKCYVCVVQGGIKVFEDCPKGIWKMKKHLLQKILGRTARICGT